MDDREYQRVQNLTDASVWIWNTVLCDTTEHQRSRYLKRRKIPGTKYNHLTKSA